MHNTIAYHPTKLRPDQIECLCKVLENTSSIDKLVRFFLVFCNFLELLVYFKHLR